MKDKVLLVDDDAMVLAGLKRQLRNQFRIDTALSGEEALQQVQENGPYAVIVSDYMMPGMDGFETLAAIRAKSTVPVIMLTAESGKENVMQIVKMGVKDYMVKPFKGEQLIERVKKIFPLEEKKDEKEEIDISKLYFTRDGDYEILTLPNKITRTVSSDIETHLGPQLQALTQSENNKMVMDMSRIGEINISLIKLILSISQISNKYNVAVKAVGTPTLSDGLKEFS